MIWRPTVITDVVLSKLEFAFSHSFTDEEACLYADIAPKTLYRYIEANEEFWQRKEILKKQPNIKAKLNWVKKMEEEDYSASKEWLERKSKNEFSLKQEFQWDLNNTNLDVSDSVSQQQKLLIAKQFLKNNGQEATDWNGEG
jgi:hypothetical protein